jgi:hypothetical protein
MPNEGTANKPREQYRLRTRLMHRSFATGRWDYDHHVGSATIQFRDLPPFVRSPRGHRVSLNLPHRDPLRADCTACRRWRRGW